MDDLRADPVGGLGHVPDHRAQLLGYGHRWRPADRDLRHVLGEVAHPFQVGGDVQRGHHQPKVGGDRCLPGEQVVHLVLDLLVHRVDLRVGVDHFLGLGPVGVEQGPGRPVQRRADPLGHGDQEPVHLGEFGLVLLTHVAPSGGWSGR